MGDLGSIPGLGSSPGEGKGNPLQYTGLENSMDLYSPRGRKESDKESGMIERPSPSLFQLFVTPQSPASSPTFLFQGFALRSADSY